MLNIMELKHHFNNLATISVPDPKLLVIQPFDKNSLDEIEKSILNADIGLNPTNDGEVVRIPIPPLSEERRKELGKVASKASEDAKVSIRTHRRFGIDEISKLKDDHSADEIKRLETQVQDITDNFVNKIDELLTVKQNEFLKFNKYLQSDNDGTFWPGYIEIPDEKDCL